MIPSKLQFLIFLVCSSLVLSCDTGPKVIESEQSSGDASTEGRTGIFSEGNDKAQNQRDLAPAVSKDIHQVVVKDVLPTDKYVYLNVEEEGNTFWIATRKQEVEVGQSYFFKEGLLKRNFESKEYNRVFDEIYLVSQIVPSNHGAGMGMPQQQDASGESPASTQTDEQAMDAQQTQVQRVEGSIPIAELVENPEAYEGKEVQISGRCTKINPNIMGRHWIHLKDGTKDDFDLVLTSQTAIPEGAVVTMKGTVALDKDFGAGYRYDIIIEQADLVGR